MRKNFRHLIGGGLLLLATLLFWSGPASGQLASSRTHSSYTVPNCAHLPVAMMTGSLTPLPASDNAGPWKFNQQLRQPADVMNSAGFVFAPRSARASSVNICGWNQESGGVLSLAFVKWAAPVKQSGVVSIMKQNSSNEPISRIPGLGVWAVGADQVDRNSNYVLYVAEGNGSWAFVVIANDGQAQMPQAVQIARYVQNHL